MFEYFVSFAYGVSGMGMNGMTNTSILHHQRVVVMAGVRDLEIRIEQQFDCGKVTLFSWHLLSADESIQHQAKAATGYVHYQHLPAQVWIVEHGLATGLIGAKVLNSTGEVVEGEITVLDGNSVQINFEKPTCGIAYLS